MIPLISFTKDLNALDEKLNCCHVDGACMTINSSFERFCTFYKHSINLRDITPACAHHEKEGEFDVNKCWNSEALTAAKMEDI